MERQLLLLEIEEYKKSLQPHVWFDTTKGKNSK